MRGEVVPLARRWIGTPYIHQASCLGAGTDCLGVIIGVWRDLFGREPEKIPAYTADWSEPQGDERLWRDAETHLVPRPLGAFEPGNVLLFRMREDAVAKHLGIITSVQPAPTFIHAYSGHSVVETTLSAPWQRRVVARFDFPEGSD